MFEVSVRSRFSSAHALVGYKGNCERLHGHNWNVEVTVSGEKLDSAGLLIDFRELKRVIDEITGGLDHLNLNELPYFSENNPSTENIARYIYAEAAQKMPAGVRVAKVDVEETEGCRGAYYETEDRSR